MSCLIDKMANLLCAERTEPPRGIEDPVLSDVSVGNCLLSLQMTTTPKFDYFQCQDQLLPYMRKVVANWMHAVCLEQQCEDTIFPLAMNYFDRFLSKISVTKAQLQLLGAVCMLLATKMRQYRCFSTALLAEYTDWSVTPEEIQQWELVVIETLGWDLSPPIANDFIDHILVRCKIALSRSSILRRHAISLMALSTIDSASITMKPSLMATGALGAAARALGSIFPSETMAEMIEDDALYVEQAIAFVSRVFEESIINQKEEKGESPQSPVPSPVPEEYIPPFKNYPDDSDYYDGNETPTDVGDINF